MNLQGKVILVTGASAGIGRATAVRLAQCGAHVVVTARRVDRLQQLVDQLGHFPGVRLALAGDIRDEVFARKLVAATVATFGRLDVLINNAGLGHKSPLAATPIEDARKIFETNVLALFNLTLAVVIQMQQQDTGQIINVSSIVGVRPLPQNGVYCASKTAVNFLSRSLRMELAATSIKVTLVYPGLTATEFGQARLGDQGGNRFGLQGVPAERVAQKIVEAIHKRHSEVYITWIDRLFVSLNRLFPLSIDAILARGAHLA